MIIINFFMLCSFSFILSDPKKVIFEVRGLSKAKNFFVLGKDGSIPV